MVCGVMVYGRLHDGKPGVAGVDVHLVHFAWAYGFLLCMLHYGSKEML